MQLSNQSTSEVKSLSVKVTIRDAASKLRVTEVPNPNLKAHPGDKGPSRQPDVTVRNEGSIVLLTPQTDAGKEWTDEHIPQAMGFGPALVVEWRYADDIIEGMQRDGLEVV